MGFYEAHRLWLISDELRSRDLQHQSLITDYSNGDADKRAAFLDWVKSKQPRRYTTATIPQEVLDKFAEMFNNG